MKSGLVLVAALALAACADYRLPYSADGSIGTGGGAGGGTGGGVAGGTGGGSGGGDAGVYSYDAGFGICANVGRTVVLSPLDLFVLLDVSGSMDYDFKWPAVRSAMKSFIGNKEFDGLGVAVQYFPLRASCRTDVYQVPAVPFGTLPGNASVIFNSLDEQRMSGGTPTVPALSGALAYTQAYLAQQPRDGGRGAALVLATDGVPDSTCSADFDAGVLANSIANVAVVARGYANASPPVKTFVIGVGKELGVLDGIAEAGGTNKAVLVDIAANADTQFITALTQIRKDALGCDFDVSTDPGENLNKNQAHVVFIPDDGTAALEVPQVNDRTVCGTGQGWYYGDSVPDGGFDAGVSDAGTADAGTSDAGTSDYPPRKIVLCGATCDVITGGKTGNLRVEIGCGVN